MTDREQETEFAKTFLEENLRRRVLALLKTRKGRRRVLSYLDHDMAFDDRFCFKVPADRQSASSISGLLRTKGAKHDCYVMSQLATLDGTTSNLQEALALVVGSGMGTVLCCVPGKLAYYEGEDPGERYILEKR